MSFYALAADGVLIFHACVIAFIVVGLALIWIGYFSHWRWTTSLPFRIVHLIAIAFVAAQSCVGMTCPLTTLENTLRQRAGQDPYDPNGCIAYWLHRMIFFHAPPWAFTICYIAFALLVVGTFIVAPPLRREKQLTPTIEQAWRCRRRASSTLQSSQLLKESHSCQHVTQKQPGPAT